MTSAFLLAIGPYHNNVNDCLDYPSHYYTDMTIGDIVTSRVFICESEDKSRGIANLLGMSYNWSFGEHHINNFQARKLLEENICQDISTAYPEFEEDAEIFERLIRYGFDFQWMPGG